MVDGDYLRHEARPIMMMIRNGEFYRPADGSVYFAVEGVFRRIFNGRYKGFPYWFVELQDKTNTLHMAFSEKSAVFKDLVIELTGAKFQRLHLQPYTEHGCNKLSVYADGKRCSPPYIALPPIKRRRDAKGLPYYNDYSERLEALGKLVADINTFNAHV